MTKGTREGITVERAARLFLQFLDLSRDVERNRADSLFGENAEITYVVDAGLAEVFLNPRDARGWSASLHAREWWIGHGLPDGWRSYAAETALLTADYLFGGLLPGQRSGRIWMSNWHRREMVRRLEQVELENVDRFRELSKDKAARDKAMDRFDVARRSVDAFERDGTIPATLPADPFLRGDVSEYLRHASRSDVQTTMFTRLALHALVNDRYVEPAEQLRRLVTPPLGRQFASIEASMRIDQPDIASMANQARDWFRALVDECSRRGIGIDEGGGPRRDQKGEEAVRSAAALWDDARTLALVLWAAARRRESDRLVFVTADNVLFDAYRRWYANLKLEDDSYSQPFCMRRLRQYAPTLNLVDSGLVQGERYRLLFEEIDEILELMLLPLNLSRRQSRTGERILDRMRELTALRSMDVRPISDDTSYNQLLQSIEKNGVETFGRRLAALMDRWRELERATLGRASTEVQRRIANVGDWLDQSSADATARANAFERYVEGVVTQIAEGSRAVSLLLAKDVIGGWHPPAEANAVRAPLVLSLVVRLADTPVDIGAALMARLEPDIVSRDAHPAPLIREGQWTDLYAKPPLMFAIAAALSVATGDWTDAVHFADRALKTGETMSAIDGQANLLELQYLAALSKRLSIGDIGPATTEGIGNRIIGLHREALDLHDHCVSQQSREGGPMTLRELRSYSERAAVRLFYVAAFNPKIIEFASHSQGEAYPPRGPRSAEIRYEIDRAEDDLRRCFAIDHLSVSSQDDTFARFKSRLRRQIYTNAAASYLLRTLWELDTPKESIFSPEHPSAVDRARDKALRNRGHTVMAAEILAFRALAGDASARRTLLGLNLPADGPLRLDVHLLRALKTLVR